MLSQSLYTLNGNVLFYKRVEKLIFNALYPPVYCIDRKQFLSYLATETHSWGLKGNGAETSLQRPSYPAVYHYYVASPCFFNWIVQEGFLREHPVAKVKIAKPKPKPYSDL